MKKKLEIGLGFSNKAASRDQMILFKYLLVLEKVMSYTFSELKNLILIWWTFFTFCIAAFCSNFRYIQNTWNKADTFFILRRKKSEGLRARALSILCRCQNPNNTLGSVYIKSLYTMEKCPKAENRSYSIAVTSIWCYWISDYQMHCKPSST